MIQSPLICFSNEQCDLNVNNEAVDYLNKVQESIEKLLNEFGGV